MMMAARLSSLVSDSLVQDMVNFTLFSDSNAIVGFSRITTRVSQEKGFQSLHLYPVEIGNTVGY
jgi:hypothetical protein